jgi:hypothetical protein
MSYILDALRKSEDNRNLSRLLNVENGTVTLPITARPSLQIIAIGAAVVVTLLVLFLVLLKLWRQPPAENVAVESSMTPAATADIRNDQAGATSLTDQLTKPRRQTVKKAPTPAPVNTAIRPSHPPLKFLRAMPDDFRNRVPPLALNIHVYSPDSSQRILYINNHQVRAGDRMDNGVTVLDIVQDGAILEYEDTRFKLARPN